MAEDPNTQGKIRARFMVTKSNVTILADFKGVSATIAWKRSGDPEGDARHLRTLIGNLPELVKDGLQEVYVLDQAKRIDFELEELFKDQEEKHDPLEELLQEHEKEQGEDPTEEFGPGPLDGRGDQ